MTLTVDGTALGTPLAFSTCLPAGCLVPLSFDGATLTKLGNGAKATLAARQLDTTQPIEFAISPKGLTGALVRAGELTKNK